METIDLSRQETQAERYITQAASMSKIHQKLIESCGGVKISEMSGPEIISPADGDAEAGPDINTFTSECDYTLYQFGDGSLLWFVQSPSHAYLQLRGVYNGLFRHTEYVAAGDKVVRDWGKIASDYPKIWDKSVRELNITVRACNCLIAENIWDIAELIRCDEARLSTIPNLGSVSLKNIKSALAEHGLKLGTNIGSWKAKDHP